MNVLMPIMLPTQIGSQIGSWVSGGGSAPTFVSAAISTSGDTIALTYSDSKASANAVSLLSQEGTVAADHTSATGEGTTVVTIPLSRVVSSTDTVLIDVGGVLHDVANGSEQARPTNYFEVEKLGQINLIADGASYYPSIIDTSDLVGWPWTVTVFASTDHSTGGIKMYGAVGDPYTPANWESYDEGLAAGRFDGFATKPAAGFIYSDPDYVTTPGDGGETPCVQRVGNEFVLSYHVSRDTGGDQEDQPTFIAIATDYPLNFVKQATPVFDGLIEPWTQYPGTPHPGYDRWALNNGRFPDHPYSYIGYGLHGGGTSSHGFIYGFDDPTDPTDWQRITLLNQSNVDNIYKHGFSTMDPTSAIPLPSGEVAMLRSGAEVSGIGDETYESVFGPNGYTVTRGSRKAIELGGVGSIDETKARETSTIPYGNAYLTVYSAYAPQQRLAIARTKINPHATPLAIEARPNHVKRFYDLKGAVSLPTGLSKVGAGALAFSADGVAIPHNADLYFDDDIDFSAAGFAEIRYWQSHVVPAEYPALPGGYPWNPTLALGEGADPSVTDGVLMVSFSGFGHINIRGKSAGVNVDSIDNAASYDWYDQLNRKHQIGMRWEIDTDTLMIIGNGGNPSFDHQSVPNAAKPTTGHGWVGRSGSSSSAPMIVEQVELRYGVASGGVVPVVSAAATTNSSVITLTLDKACLGFGTGLTLKIGGVAATGVWQRASATSYTFTAATGTFQSGQTITYDVASTDVRSIEDLVAIQNVTGASVTNSL